jgi:hypothetical protein
MPIAAAASQIFLRACQAFFLFFYKIIPTISTNILDIRMNVDYNWYNKLAFCLHIWAIIDFCEPIIFEDQ